MIYLSMGNESVIFPKGPYHSAAVILGLPDEASFLRVDFLRWPMVDDEITWVLAQSNDHGETWQVLGSSTACGGEDTAWDKTPLLPGLGRWVRVSLLTDPLYPGNPIVTQGKATPC